MRASASGDLRLVTVWHAEGAGGTLHFSLYNNGPSQVSVGKLHLTGGFWVTADAVLRDARLCERLSNYSVVAPSDPFDLEPGAVWTFSIADANIRPRRAGDGVQSAYLVAGDETILSVAVQPLSLSLDVEALGAKPLEKPAVEIATVGMPTLAVIPFPNVTTLAIAPLEETGPVFLVKDADKHRADEIARVNRLAQTFGGKEAPVFVLSGNAARGLSLRDATDPRLGDDGYRINCEDGVFTLLANGRNGFRHGLVTLAQMAAGARADVRRFGLPVSGTVSDVPRFGWRGLHLDVARTFYEVSEVLRIADLAAWLKLNVFHLHLNDDEGWRIAVDGYPEIASVAAWRGHGLPLPPLLGSGPAPYGGVYSSEDVARMSSHCAELGLLLLPEIDLPGHGHAAMTALPSLREPGDAGGYRSVQGFEGNALHPLLPQTRQFVSAAITSALRLFDGPAMHIGGDEVAPDTWSGSPSARAAAGGRPTGSLQSSLLELGHRFVTKAGRKTVVWEDAVHHANFDPQKTVALVWQHPDRAFELAARGHDVVLAPGNAYYLDMAHSDAWESTGGHWAGTVPIDKTYGFEAGHGWPAEQLSRLRGVHACIWGEYMHDRRNFDDLVFPRIYAFAERAWIQPANRDFAGFRSRLSVFPRGLPRTRWNQ